MSMQLSASHLSMFPLGHGPSAPRLGTLLCCLPPLSPIAHDTSQETFSGQDAEESPPQRRVKWHNGLRPCSSHLEGEPQASPGSAPCGPPHSCIRNTLLSPHQRGACPPAPAAPPFCVALRFPSMCTARPWPCGSSSLGRSPGPFQRPAHFRQALASVTH